MSNKISGHCTKCYGSGQQRYRDQIGTIRFNQCKHCHGRGRVWMEYGSGEHRISAKIIQGLTPGIRKGHSAYAASGTKRYGKR